MRYAELFLVFDINNPRTFKNILGKSQGRVIVQSLRRLTQLGWTLLTLGWQLFRDS
jgi:hypothetical protein